MRYLYSLCCLILAFSMSSSMALASMPETGSPNLKDKPEISQEPAPSKVRIAINKEYFEVCEAELGPFPKKTINCSDAAPIPTERTQADGNVIDIGNGNLPDGIPRFRGNEVGQLKLNQTTQLFDNITTCDKPSGIFRDMRNAGCVPGNRINHLTNIIKDRQVVDWVYICRKNSNFLGQDNRYNELGLIGYNRNTGKTCFFAGQPTQTLKIKGQWKIIKEKDGKQVETTKTEADIPLIEGNNIPAPNFRKFDEKMVFHWSIPTNGGCTGCHSNGPFIRYPFNELVCLANSSDNCLKSFSNRPACQNYLEQTYARSKRINFRCRDLQPKREPGMLYSAVSPFDKNGELSKFLSAMSDADKNDPYYKALIDFKWNIPHRLDSAEIGPCTQCHDIGNGVYASTFINSLFSVHDLEDGKFQPQVNELWRTRLFLSNVSETQRSNSAHDRKIKTEGTLPIKVSSTSIDKENELRQKLSLRLYQKALKKINDCGQTPEKCHWDIPWTVERVAREPLKYLQERCGYCHTPGMAQPVLTTEADFKRSNVVDKIISRMNERTYPMPPSGQLPASVLPILADYLRK